MAPRGVKPKTIEQHKADGTYRPERHAPKEGVLLQPDPTAVDLPMATHVPDEPADLGDEGKRLWARCWSHPANQWLSPDTDIEAVTNTCRLADDLQAARQNLSTSADVNAATTMHKAYIAALGELGFTPTSRARLGVAIVKQETALEQLARRRAEREQPA